jgi:hypothetical protein
MNLLILLALFIAAVLLAAVAVRAIGGNLTMVDDWKKAWKFYSVWAMALVAALPDIYNAMISSGLLGGDDAPSALTWGIRIGAIGALLLRLVNQQKPPLPDDTDKAGA